MHSSLVACRSRSRPPKKKAKKAKDLPKGARQSSTWLSWMYLRNKLGIWEPLTLPRLIAAIACQAYLYQHLVVSTSWVSWAGASCFGHQKFRWNEVYIFSPRCSASAQMIARSISATTFRERLGTLRNWVRKYFKPEMKSWSIICSWKIFGHISSLSFLLRTPLRLQ